MEFKKLKYFIVIAETLNISKAAERLHMSQPPLTYQLKQLEDDLDVKLFERTTRRMSLTSAGQKLYERAVQILDLVQITKEEIISLQEGVKTIKVGFVASSSALLSSETIVKYHHAYPEIKFSMREGNTYEILDYLNHGLIDIGLVRTPFNGEKYDITYLEDEPMIVMFRGDEFKSSIDVKALKEKPLVLDKRFRPLIEQSCLKEGFVPNIVCEGEDSRSILSFAEAGLGIAVLPLSGKNWLKESSLQYALIDSDALNTKSAIVRRKENTYEAHLDAFINLLKKPVK